MSKPWRTVAAGQIWRDDLDGRLVLVVAVTSDWVHVGRHGGRTQQIHPAWFAQGFEYVKD